LEDGNISWDTEKLLDGFFKISRLYDAELFADCYAPDTSFVIGVTEDEIDGDSFINALQEAQEGLPPRLCRELRQLFLNEIHPVLSPDAMREVLQASLSALDKPEHKLAAEHAVSEVFALFGVEREE
jgi:hypothetical protein